MERTLKLKKINKISVQIAIVVLAFTQFFLVRGAEPGEAKGIFSDFRTTYFIIALIGLYYCIFLLWFDEFFKKKPKERDFTPLIGIVALLAFICYMIFAWPRPII